MDTLFYSLMFILGGLIAFLILGIVAIWLLKAHGVHLLTELLIHVGLNVGGRVYKRLPESWRQRLDRWFPPTHQAPLPTSNRQRIPPRVSGPEPQGGNPVAVNNPNPARAGQQANQPHRWLAIFTFSIPLTVTFITFVVLFVLNRALYSSALLLAQEPMPIVILDLLVAVLVGHHVRQVFRINQLEDRIGELEDIVHP